MSSDIDKRLDDIEAEVRDLLRRVSKLEKQIFKMEDATFAHGTKRYRPVPSEGIVELHLPDGKKLYRMLFEEVSE